MMIRILTDSYMDIYGNTYRYADDVADVSNSSVSNCLPII